MARASPATQSGMLNGDSFCQLKTRIDLTVEKSSQQYKISSVCGAEPIDARLPAVSPLTRGVRLRDVRLHVFFVPVYNGAVKAYPPCTRNFQQLRPVRIGAGGLREVRCPLQAPQLRQEAVPLLRRAGLIPCLS